MSIGRLGNYEILERIGEGGMGVVFRAHYLPLDHIRAIKVLPENLQSNREYRDRLMHEARTLATIDHPHIAICYDCGEAALEPADLVNPGAPGPHPDRVLYLAMEYVAGSDIAGMLLEGPIPLRRVLDLAIQIASGLDAAHRVGVIHRDLKPANIRVTPNGQVKILDFGLARTPHPPGAVIGTTSSTSSLGSVVGTAGYMSPQQAQGERVDARADLFSFGVILYQMVTGHLPFEGKTAMAELYAVANFEPHPLARFASGVPPELQRIVTKLLEKNPDDRYQSAHEVLTDLQRLAGNFPSSSRRLRQVVERASVRRGTVVGVAIAVLTLAIVMIGPLIDPNRATANRVALTDFKNMTGDGGLEYLGAGLSMDLLDALVQNTDLVVARGAVRNAQGPEDDPRVVARSLGAGRVVTGQIRAAPPALRLYVQVVDGRGGSVQWAGAFDFTPQNLYGLRQVLTQELIARLGGVRATPPRRAPPPSSVAFEAYLRGLDALSDPDNPVARDRALASFEQAIGADSSFALAWAGCARALWWLYDRDHDPAMLRRAVQVADRAVALDPELVQTHLARARIAERSGRALQAVNELEEVLQDHPNSDEAWLLLGPSYRKIGELDKAEAAFRRSVALRPSEWKNWSALAAFLMLARADYGGARAAYQKVIELAPEMNRGYEGIASSFILEGRYAEAIAAYRRLPRPVTNAGLASNIATAYFFSGQNEPARQYYLMAVTLEPTDAALRQNLGDSYTRLGRLDEARAQYRSAIGLLRAGLQMEPGNLRLSLQLAKAFAKVGSCDSASAQITAVGSRVPSGDAELQHELAKVEALCGRTREAVAALRQMVKLGSPTRLFRDEDEFRALRSDPEFRRLLATNKS